MNSAKDKYRCGICETIYSAEDLEFSCQHSALGKYSVSPDPEDTECPFCGNKDMNAIYPMPKPEIVKPDASELTRMRKIWDAELALAELSHKRSELETISVSDWDDDTQPYECTSIMTDTLVKDRNNARERAAANSFIAHKTLELSELRATMKPEVKPTMYPRTVEQNCLSGNITIKPQINWDAFDNEYGHLVRRM